MTPRTLLPAALAAALFPATLLGSPPPSFELRPASVDVGDRWAVRMSTRVAQQGGPDSVETAIRYRCRVLARNEAGQVKLETRFSPQRIAVVSGEETTEETQPARTAVEWGEASDVAGGTEVGPCSLLERKRAHVGERWTSQGTLMVGGVAPVVVTFAYAVESASQRHGETLLKVTFVGDGVTPTEGGGAVSVRAQGTLLINPACVDRPRKAELEYEFRLTGQGMPDAASKTTILLETKRI